MTTIDQPFAMTATMRERAGTAPTPEAATATTTAEAATATATATTTDVPRRGLVFWIVRYLPAEVAATAAMVIGGLLATMWTDAAPLIAVAALVGEVVGFYAVLAVTIYLEQAQAGATRRRTVGRTGLLLVAEFGAAELLDTLLVRPAALMLGVWLLPDPLWGLLAGKVVADIVFYAVAAGAFTVTATTGLRDARRAPSAEVAP
jgi:hypothetical protein